MKMQLVKILTLTCLLLGSSVVKAESEKQVWLETSKSGMREFVTAVGNAGYIDNEGNILLAGIGYAGQFAIGPDVVKEIVPQAHQSNEGVGRLLFIYNRLYNADGSVRQSITVDEFVAIGQGVGWYVPTSAFVMQRLASVNEILKIIKGRAESGKMIESDLDGINQYLYKLTGRTGIGQINPDRVDAMDRRIHEIQDGEWTLAMRKAARQEAGAAMAPTGKRLETDMGEMKTAFDSQLSAVKNSVSLIAETALENEASITENTRKIGGISNTQNELSSELQALSLKADKLTKSTDYQSWIIGCLLVLLIAMISWMTVMAIRLKKAKTQNLQSKEDSVSGHRPAANVADGNHFDPRQYIADIKKSKAAA